MRAHYTYDIATRINDCDWQVIVVREDTFTRDPQSTARSLLERWINDHHGQLPGGRVFVFGTPKAVKATGIVANVRIRVYSTRSIQTSPPLAVAYLGHHKRDDTTGRRTRWLRRWLSHDYRTEAAATRSANAATETWHDC